MIRNIQIVFSSLPSSPKNLDFVHFLERGGNIPKGTSARFFFLPFQRKPYLFLGFFLFTTRIFFFFPPESKIFSFPSSSERSPQGVAGNFFFFFLFSVRTNETPFLEHLFTPLDMDVPCGACDRKVPWKNLLFYAAPPLSQP